MIELLEINKQMILAANQYAPIDNGYTTYKAPIVDRDNNRYIDSTSAHPAAIRDRMVYSTQPNL